MNEKEIEIWKENRKDFDNWVSTLTQLELGYFEKEYRKEFNKPILTKIDFSEIDSWLFDKWILKVIG